MRIKLLVVFLLAPLLADPASAAVIYTYTGTGFEDVSFDDAAVPGMYTTAMSVAGTLTLASALGANDAINLLDPTGLTFSFSDGRNVFTEADTYSTFQISLLTDSSGEISQWQVTLESEDFARLVQTRNDVLTIDQGLVADPGSCSETGCLGGDAAWTFTAGTWSSSVSEAPEPAVAALLASSLLASGLILRRRRCRAWTAAPRA